MSRLLPTAPPTNRSCGDCQACCVVLNVWPRNESHDELPLTRAFEHCQFQQPNACAVYEQRPSPCAAYHCMWRLGWRDDDSRPDLLGVLVEGSRRGWLFVIETRPGGYDDKAKAYCRETRDRIPGSFIHVTPWGSENPEGWWDGGAPTEDEFVSVGIEEGFLE